MNSDNDFLGFSKAMDLKESWDELQKLWGETEEVPYYQKTSLTELNKLILGIINDVSTDYSRNQYELISFLEDISNSCLTIKHEVEQELNLR